MKVSRWVIVFTWIFAISNALGAILNWADDLTGNWSALIAVSAFWIVGLVKKNPVLIMAMLTISLADNLGAFIRGSELGGRGNSFVVVVLMGVPLYFWVRAYSWSVIMGEQKQENEG